MEMNVKQSVEGIKKITTIVETLVEQLNNNPYVTYDEHTTLIREVETLFDTVDHLLNDVHDIIPVEETGADSDIDRMEEAYNNARLAVIQGYQVQSGEIYPTSVTLSREEILAQEAKNL
jgi:hypothetical protein